MFHLEVLDLRWLLLGAVPELPVLPGFGVM